MTPLTRERLDCLRDRLDAGIPMADALSLAVGGTAVGGIWRIFSTSWPHGGAAAWNSEFGWRSNWSPFVHEGVVSIGEDIFGNQLVMVSESQTVRLWNHENAELHDLLVGPEELLTTVLENGIEWIDFYSDGSLDVARNSAPLADDAHLHWTTPLVLGGPVSASNATVLPVRPHLIGHAKLWRQLSGLPPGSAVAIK